MTYPLARVQTSDDNHANSSTVTWVRSSTSTTV